MKTTKYHDKYFEFLRTLLARLNGRKENTVFSPFSLLMLLAIAADATHGKTREEIAQVLYGEMDYEEVKEALSMLQKQITQDNILHSANAVIVREDHKLGIIDGYEDRLSWKGFGQIEKR